MIGGLDGSESRDPESDAARSPWRCGKSDVKAIVALVVMAATVFAPIVFGGKMFLNGNLIGDHLPRLAWAAGEIAAGRIPLWADALAFGFPVYLDQFQVVNPPFVVLLRLLSTIDAADWAVVSGFLVGSLATYACGRRFGLSALGSFLTAAVFSYATEQVFWGQEPPWALSIYLFPAALLLATYVAKGGFGRVAVAAPVYAYLIVAGYIEMTLFATGLAFLWTVQEAVSAKKGFAGPFRFALTVASGALIASPWLLPAIRFIADTTRSGGVTNASADGAGVMTILDAIHMFFPSLSIRFMPIAALQDGTIYVFMGVIPFFLALSGLRRFKTDPRVRFFAAVAAFCLLVFMPLVSIYPIVHRLPVLNLFRFGWKWSYPFMFSVAMMAGLEIERIGKGADLDDRFWRLARRVGAAVVAVYLLCWTVVVATQDRIATYAIDYFSRHSYSGILGRPLDYYAVQIRRVVADFSAGAAPWRSGALAGLVPFVALAVLFHPRIRRLVSARVFAGIVVGVTALSLVLAAYGNVSYTDKSAVTTPPIMADYLGTHVGDARIAPFVPYFSDYRSAFGLDLYDEGVNQAIGKELLYSNAAMLYGFDSAVSGGSLITERPYRMSLVVLANGARTADEFRRNLTAREQDRIDGFSEIAPALRMLSVRYVLSSFPLKAPFVEEYRATTTLGFPVVAYRLDDPLPKVFLATSTVFLPEGDEPGAFGAVMSETDFGSRTYVECDACSSDGSVTSSSKELLSVKKSPMTLEASVRSDRGAWLVLSQTYLSSWKAYVDGKPAPLRRANYVFEAVSVPAGEHQVLVKNDGFWERYFGSIRELTQGYLPK